VASNKSDAQRLFNYGVVLLPIEVLSGDMARPLTRNED